MATLWITEYTNIAESFKGKPVLSGQEPAVTTQTVSYTTTTQSLDFQDVTRFVRLIADADVYVMFGESPTATVSSTKLQADVAEYFGIERNRNETLRLAAYDGSS